MKHHGIEHVVYYSSLTENTKRFVDKLGLPSTRIPLRMRDEFPVVTTPFCLICPAYMGGHTFKGAQHMDESAVRYVPLQVEKFLSNPTNRDNMKCVVASGNINFGEDFCKNGDIISQQYGVPYVYRFELMGTPEDVRILRHGLRGFTWEDAA